ncbi:RhsD protein (fragment) [Xanthomonas citri pv. fuscans]
MLANANKLHYIEPDHLGSPRVVIDPTRDVAVWTWSLKGEAFGNTAPNQDPDGDGAALVLDMRFPGQRFDAASGLNQNYFRDYEAATGRYGQSDPIGLEGGLSTFAYVQSAPMTSVDPYGLQRVIRLPQPGFGGSTGGLSNPNNPNNYGANGQPVYPPDPSAEQILGGILGSPMVNSSQFPLGQLISNSIAIAGTVCGDDPDRCYNRWQEESGKCVIWGSLGARWVRACRDRARYRFQLCTSNGGTPDPNEPPE